MHPRILVLDRAGPFLDQLEAVAREMNPRPIVVHCDQIGAAADALTERGPFDVLVAGALMGTPAGITRLEVIHDEVPTTALVLAFSRRPDTRLRDIVRTGATDLLQLPVSDTSLRASLERAVAIGRCLTPAPAPAAVDGPAGPGHVITISSATGGCGKTFFATNLGYFLSHHTGLRTCIVDLDLQFGEVSTALRLRPPFTIFDALQRDDADDGDLHARIEEYLVDHDTGVHVLAAPKDPSEADRISPPDVTRIIDALRSRFDYVIVDTPAALTEVVLAAFDLSEEVYVMATLDLPSVRNMGVFLNTLEKLKMPAEKVRLILNKAERDVGIEVSQITKLFAQGFDAVLPYDREVSRSINVGMPVLASAPDTEVSRRMATGMRLVLPEELQGRVPELPVTVTGGSILRRLLGRPAAGPTTI